MIQKRPLKPPVKNMPFAFSTSALLLPELYSTLRTEFEAQDGAMLHGAMINLRRRIVNQARGFPCRAAAQFNFCSSECAGRVSVAIRSPRPRIAERFRSTT